ncbi:MAG TPA: hypothetical protein VFQ91_25880, partial [Bryobacteraceae bacterium]|nr:hypothetical protein [Bryobacteraceae bacterium]
EKRGLLFVPRHEAGPIPFNPHIRTVVSGGGGGGGPDAFYWSGTSKGDASYTQPPTSTFYSMHTDAYGVPITIGAAGTVTKLAIKARSSSGTITAKLALYDNSGNRVTDSGEAAINITTTPGWFELTLATPKAVSAATYQLWWSGSSTNLQIYYDADFNGLSKGGVAYASFPPATITTPGTETNTGFGGRVYVD